MADEQDEQQRERSTFHWPPTTEELDSIQVIEVSNGEPPSQGSRLRKWRAAATTARSSGTWWRHALEDSVIAQAGLVAASLAAIGIAVTSLLAPVQPPAAHAARMATHTPLVARTQPLSAATTPAVAPAEPESFRPMVTLDLERPATEPVPATTFHTSPIVRTPSREEIAAAQNIAYAPRPSPTRRRVRRQEAGKDPVSRFAVRTGLSVWKAMRAFGRSLKRDPHEADAAWTTRSTARAAVGRRTAAATDLEATDAPSDH